MGTLKGMITTAAAAIVLMAPLVGSAEAKRGDGRGGQHRSEARDDSFRDSRGRGGQRGFETRDDSLRGWRGRGHGRFGRRFVHTPVIDERIANQHRRIRRARRSGRLNGFQAERLRGRLFRIRSARRFARSDGHVSRGERRRLMNMLDENSHRIRRARRFGRFGRGRF